MSSQPSNAGGLVGQQLGKYKLLALLALGGTAEIYLARIGGVAGFEKLVVVKCLHDHLADDNDFVRMFRDEARLGAQLTHSNIVQTLELGEHQGRYYMVMEYLSGMSMAVIARKAAERVPGGRLPLELTFGLMSQACSGLHYAHNRRDSAGQPMNIVHRDVSPQNLVVSFDGNLKVVDFGIAKAAVRETQTQSGTIKGKFAYMSPEQCVAGNVDRRTDVFALGIVVHELLTGRRLFKRESAYDTYQAILQCNVPAPSKVATDLDPALDAIVLKALTKDVNGRYDDAEQFGDAMQGYLHRNGIVVNAGTVSQFFDRHFGEEIKEHGERMRAIMSGRQTQLDQWDDGDEEPGSSDAGAERPTMGFDAQQAGAYAGYGSGPPATMDVPGAVAMPNERSEVLDANMLEEMMVEGEEEDGATQIENNPLERIRDQMLAQVRASHGQDQEQANAEKKTVAFSVPSVGAAPPGPGAPPSAGVGGAAGASAKTLVPGHLYSGAGGAGGQDDDGVDEDAQTLIAEQSIDVQKLLADAKASIQPSQSGPVPGVGPQGQSGYPGASNTGATPQPASYGQNPMQGGGPPGYSSTGPAPQPQGGFGGTGPAPQPQGGFGSTGPAPQPQGGFGGYQPGQQGPGAPYGQGTGPVGGPGYPAQPQGPYGHQQMGTGPVPGGPEGQPQESSPTPAWLLAVVFLVCAGVGFGATLLVSKLF